ncbi:ligand-dependent nuclear receptor-interacting factor 1 isoform X2 [Petaurus breviceps papuanus]|uniref:ligand-dependent nuclear receptor-interacting factor 1 isoform X2 n=1 Tax=Petaurus breviceps papuanus TaxID=3040969 RepID=UPI0036D9E45A
MGKWMFLLKTRQCWVKIIAGCMYQVIQTTGLDGKNLLKLLPIPNSSGNFMPLVQSSVTSDTSKNISNPVHVTIQTQLASTPTTASIQFPVFQTTNSGNYFLSRAVDKSENVRGASVGKDSLPSAPAAQNNASKVEKLTLQKVPVSPPTTQGDTAYMLVDTKNLPVTVKSPVLPYGHHLQIPANAEVKSVPASSLPPPIQQKILAAAATNTSGTAEASKVPTVIYVSPVNTVKSVVPKTFKNICPKPANPTEAAKPTVLNTPQTPAKNPTTDVSNNEGQKSRDAPMKWVVQENPQSSPCLVPVKSSNNMASKILKTLMDMKNVESSSLSMPPLCSGTSSGAQAKITPIKDNALVMFNGKVYLLAKKGSEVLPSQTDQQNSAAPDASPRKDGSQTPNSNSVTKITNEVVNIVLAKNKTASLKETKLISDTQLVSELVPSLEQHNRVECTSLSAQSPQHVKQPLCLEQYKTTHIKLNLPDVVSSAQNAKNEMGISHTKDSSDDTTITSKHCVCTDQEPKNQGEMAFVLETRTQSRNQKESCWREYAELRKNFGITKDLRVRLTRIPLFDSTSLYSPSNLTNNISSKESNIIVDLTSGEEEESQELTLQQNVDKKRKAKTVMKVDCTKKKKSGNDVNSSMDTGTDCPSPQILNSISPDSALLPQSNNNNLICCTNSTEENSPEPELHAQDGPDRGADSPASVSFEQEPPVSQDCYIDDSFPTTLPELDETIRDEKIKRLKQLLKEREAALEEIRKKMQQS